MAAITFGTAHIGGRLKAGLTILREMLDAFVSHRMRLAALEAEHVCPRQPPGRVIAIEKSPMIAVDLTCPDLSRRQAPEPATKQDGERPAILPAEAPATVTAQFQLLDPGIVNEAIPAFFIGRNKQGFWIARDVNGRIGGIFLLENSALSFAKRNSWPAGCATIFPSERFELDLENKGNPLVTHLGPLIHLAMRHRQRMAALIRKMTEALKRRLEDFHVL